MPIGIYKHKSLSEETKNKIHSAMLGRKHSIETKEKIRLATISTQFKEGHKTNRGRKRPDISKLDQILKKGKRFSQQTEFQKGHNVPLEWVEKMREKKIGVPSNKHGKSYEELYGHEKTLQIKAKLAERHKDKTLSEIHKRAISQAHKRKFLDENFRKQWAVRFHKKPNPLEERLIGLINSNNLPFKYTGNYEHWIGSKNPDFTNTESKKQVIELLGEYWHQKRKNISFYQTAEGTIEHYKKFGFSCLVIWDYELKEPEKVFEKIKAFSESD